jgi:hypothetical protein
LNGRFDEHLNNIYDPRLRAKEGREYDVGGYDKAFAVTEEGILNALDIVLAGGLEEKAKNTHGW